MNNIKSKAKTTPKPKPVAKDLKPQKDVKGGVLIGMLLPAVQKVREGT